MATPGTYGYCLFGEGLYGYGADCYSVTDSPYLTRVLPFKNGLDNFLGFVYRTTPNTYPCAEIITGSTVVRSFILPESYDWTYNYVQITGVTWTGATVRLSMSGANSVGSTISLNYINLTFSGAYNPLDEHGPTVRLIPIEASNNITFTGRPVAHISSTDLDWNVQRASFPAAVRENFYGGALTSTYSSGTTDSYNVANLANYTSKDLVFSAYARKLGTNKCANDGLILSATIGTSTYSTRFFLPSGVGTERQYRQSVAFNVPSTAPNLILGISYSGNNHGPTEQLYVDGYQLEVLDSANRYPCKGRPSAYHPSGSTIKGYKFETELMDGVGKGYIANPTLLDGWPGHVKMETIDQYSKEASLSISHDNYKQVTVLRNFGPETSTITGGFGRVYHKPMTARLAATYNISFKMSTDSLRCSGNGAGLQIGIQQWTNFGEPPTFRILGSGYGQSLVNGNDDWIKKSVTFTQNSNFKYFTPFIMASGMVGTVKIDDFRFIDLELNARTRKYEYDSTRPALEVDVADNYNVIDNIFREGLGSTTWRTIDDDVFLSDALDVKQAPMWNYIWRQNLYVWVGKAGDQWVVSDPAPYNVWKGNGAILGTASDAQRYGLVATSAGYVDHPESVSQMNFTDSMCVDESNSFLLYHTNSILRTLNGATYNQEFRANANRFYLMKQGVGENDSAIIRLNDALTRDIRLNDGSFFGRPLYPHRALATITGQTGTMTGYPAGTQENPYVSWRSQIHDIATHALSPFVFYCGTIYYWDDSDATAVQVYQSANFIGAIPKSFPDTVGIRNINLSDGFTPGPVEKQYGAIIYISGNTPITGGIGHPKNINTKRYVGLACTGEYYEGSDIPSLIVAESTGSGGLGNINLKVLFHTAYNDVRDLDFGTFWYETNSNIGCTGAPEFYYNASKAQIYDVMQIQNVTLPNKIYNGATAYPSGASMVPFKLSYNDKSKMLYSHTKDWNPEFAKMYIFKDFQQWSYERLKYYTNVSTVPTQSNIAYKTLDVTNAALSPAYFELYSFTTLSGFVSGGSSIPLLSFYDPQEQYMNLLETAPVTGDQGDESTVSTITSFYRTKYQLDGNNLVSKYSDGSNGSRNQTEYIEQAVYKEPVISAVNNYSDECILSGAPLPSGIYNNLKVTQDYTINYMTGELWFNKIPATTEYDIRRVKSTTNPAQSIFTVMSGFNISGAYDRELFASYSNRYTIPFCASKDETLLSFLGKIAEADHALANIDQDNKVKYEPKDYAVNTRLSPSYQPTNHKNLLIPNLGLSSKENLGSVQNSIFEDVSFDREGAKPVSWSNYSVGSGYVTVTEDIAKFGRRAAAIISTGKNYVGYITSNPILVTPYTEYTASLYYFTQDCDRNAQYSILPNSILSSGSISGWNLVSTGTNLMELNSRETSKNRYTLDITSTGGFVFTTNYAIPVDIQDNYTLTVEAAGANTLNIELLFTYSGGGVAYSKYDTLALSSTQQTVTVTGCPRTIFEQSSSIIPQYVIPRISSTGSATDFVIGNIVISGDRKHGPVFGIYEYNSSNNLINKTTFNLRTDTNGFNRFRNTFTTDTSTAYVRLSAGLRNTYGNMIIDGARLDLGNNVENFIINDSLLEVSDFPLGTTTYTKNYKQDIDYLYNRDRSIISLVDKNLLPNGWFKNFDGASPDIFTVHITGTTNNNHPVLYKNENQGLFNYHSLGITVSGNGKAELISTVLPIDADRDYRIAINAIASGSTDVGTEETTAILPVVKIEYYDEEMKLLSILSNAVIT